VASLVTGCYPGRHGLVGNTFYFPQVGLNWKVDTGLCHDIMILDKKTKGNTLQIESLGEILRKKSHLMASVNIGSSGNAYLNNHKAEEVDGLVIHPHFTIPHYEAEELINRFGTWPSADIPNSARIHHATTILLEHVIPKYKPTVAFLWFSEPDSTQHKTNINSPKAKEGITQADNEIGRILEYLNANGLETSTDILITSDHGQSTVTQTIDVTKELIKAGLKKTLVSSDVLMAANGGCVLIYVQNHNQTKVKAITNFLMTQIWCGPIFTFPSHCPGAFPLNLIQSQNTRSPDILMSFKWESSKNYNGVKGVGSFAKGDINLGAGSHGSISPHEIHNTLIATGPHFKQGIENPLPSGNVDILPTLMKILRLNLPDARDGRVLEEALVDGSNPEEILQEKELYNAETEIGKSTFQQKIQISKVDKTLYLDKAWVL
jgi:predicted AlkP superfamily pyrophosphatase or phosphodiesterase